MSFELLDKLPTIERVGGPRPLDPKVVEFLDFLKENPGKWAKWPLPRKTKPEVPEGYSVASRGGVLYAGYAIS